MTVKEGRENFSWYGYGPLDSYNDRHSGARLGLFSGSVDEQFTHHTYPQENGNKYRCLWASLSDDNGIGLIAEGKPYIETSVMHYSLENLSQAENENQLEYTDNVTWNIDYKTYPIGNRSCGPPPLKEYVLFARAKGLKKSRIIFTHALKNAWVPVLNYIGPASAFLLTGSFAVESVFTIPGLGREFVMSIANRDYTLILGLTVFMGTVVIVLNLITDLLGAWFDPKIRRAYKRT